MKDGNKIMNNDNPNLFSSLTKPQQLASLNNLKVEIENKLEKLLIDDPTNIDELETINKQLTSLYKAIWNLEDWIKENN